MSGKEGVGGREAVWQTKVGRMEDRLAPPECCDARLQAGSQALALQAATLLVHHGLARLPLTTDPCSLVAPAG